jgi:isopenicillin N synthase-like dioxygenase
MSTDIPIIDFARAASSPEQLAGELLAACTDWGFFFVENHPIAQEDIDGIFELERQFFALPLSEKTKAPYIAAQNAGYKPASSYGADGKFTDPREAISINKWPTSSHAAAAILPPVLSDARGQLHAFQRQVQEFTTQLLELIALALGLPPTTFARNHDPERENFDNFELMHYPPVAAGAGAGTTPDASPTFRISPHTDWGTLTLLFQSTVGGLEVRPPKYTSPALSLSTEKWTPAPALPDKILVNIGDMLEFWTAGKLKSTWHRVVPTPTEGNLDRYTFAYFLHPDKDCVLVPMGGMEKEGWVPRYEGVGRTAETHIHARIRAVHGGKKKEHDDAKRVVPEMTAIVAQA